MLDDNKEDWKGGDENLKSDGSDYAEKGKDSSNNDKESRRKVRNTMP